MDRLLSKVKSRLGWSLPTSTGPNGGPTTQQSTNGRAGGNRRLMEMTVTVTYFSGTLVQYATPNLPCSSFFFTRSRRNNHAPPLAMILVHHSLPSHVKASGWGTCVGSNRFRAATLAVRHHIDDFSAEGIVALVSLLRTLVWYNTIAWLHCRVLYGSGQDMAAWLGDLSSDLLAMCGLVPHLFSTINPRRVIDDNNNNNNCGMLFCALDGYIRMWCVTLVHEHTL
jgi:hypothetical protein